MHMCKRYFFFRILYNKIKKIFFFFSTIHVTFTTTIRVVPRNENKKANAESERVCRAKGKVSSGTPSLVRQAALIHVHRVRFSRWLPRMAEPIPETF